MKQQRNMKVCLLYALIMCYIPQAQSNTNKNYWQQEISYKMEVELDVLTNILTGSQTIKYKNNSPETLDKVFFHLYLNAFQPGSAMDVRSAILPDPDPRVGSRIGSFLPEEIGYQRILKLTHNGENVTFSVVGTILEVDLPRPIKPGQTAKFQMEYDAQVPIQVRRTGRDNGEGIRYSMTQWYPKMCEFDEQGWHAHPYIAREFYGVWGDFDVKISIDATYIVAATGLLKNGNKIGNGYSVTTKSKNGKTTWQFVAENVHDFAWAADPDYIPDHHVCADGTILRAFYQDHETYTETWQALLPIMEEALRYLNHHFGKYAYPTYSIIQGGDGGMEYPMATLITGHRSLTSLVGVSVHELVHMWYQMTLGFNESYYYWMDEGFTNYASERVMEHLKSKNLIPGTLEANPFESFYKGYANLVKSGLEEPMGTHADHYETNTAYGISAYSKGAVFLNQLEYVVGKKAFDTGLLSFYNDWKFKHPDDNAFIRSMERVSGLELDWYKDYMVYTTKTIDYAIDTLVGEGNQSAVLLSRQGLMPMPVDVVVSLTDGRSLYYTIPLDIMRGNKTEKTKDGTLMEILPDWDWVNPGYFFILPYPLDLVSRVMIDPSSRLADLNPDNNQWPPVVP